MSEIVELSTGHVFAKGSVKALTPFTIYGWKIHGVGFVVEVTLPPVKEAEGVRYSVHWDQVRRERQAIYAEFVEKLLGSK